MPNTIQQLLALCTLTALLVLPNTHALAQSGGFVCQNTSSNSLDCDQIEQAAQPLIARGAQVAVYLTDTGDDTGQDFLQRLSSDELGFADQDRVQPELIGIYVSMQPRYAELRVGDNWTSALNPGDSLTRIRTEQLTPALRDGEYTRGYVDSLKALETTIAGRSGNAPENSSIPTGALVGIGLAGLAGGGYAARRWKKKRDELEQQRWHVDDARQKANSAIIEVSQALQKEKDLAEYDLVTYSVANARTLAEQRQIAEQRFVELQEHYARHVEHLEQAAPGLAMYEDMTSSFKNTHSQATELLPTLKANMQLRQQLDQQNQQVGTEFERIHGLLDQALALLPSELSETQQATLREQHQTILAQIQSDIEQHDTEQALSRMQQTEIDLQQTRSLSQRIQALKQQLEQATIEADTLAEQGYRVEASRSQLSKTKESLPNVLQMLVDSGIHSASQQLSSLENSLSHATSTGRDLITQRANNEQRLLELGVQARRVSEGVNQAHQVFDLVDEFAETCWSDIRGNGSNAEAALARAGKSWQQALHNNGPEQQDFQAAAQELQTVDKELQHANQLTEAIIQRLKDLEHARIIAQEELTAARTDLEAAQSYLHEYNRDISPAPEAELEQASSILQAAEAEAMLEKPDWLKLVRSAQEANQLADTVLSMSRSEAEAIEHMRQQIKNAYTLASNQLQRTLRYYNNNRADISFASTSELKDMEEELAAAAAAGLQAENLEDFQRLEALRSVYQRITAMEERTDKIYSKMHADIIRVESQRAAEASASASNNDDSDGWGWLSSSSSSSRRRSSSSSSSSSWSSGGSSGGSSWGGGGSSGGSSWGSGSKSGGGW